MVDDLPHLTTQNEIGQYHAKLNQKGPEFEVESMTSFIHYLISMEYEVFAMGTLMKNVEYARASYEEAFNETYSFQLKSVDMIFSHMRGSEFFVIRLEVKPYILSNLESSFASLSSTNVNI